ncbi:MAG: hypothetical protein KatS3mg085_142 [Candidatus Dojkabacteria bacterium]|nr:MAG: hypothetical protein KatS3mg085_142 [Candidatus Dojkabacteria bacterium]
MIQTQDQTYTTLTESNFKSETEEGFVVIDFWADWCGPCIAFAPVFESVAQEMAGKLKFAKVNVDENPSIATEFSVMSIPTIVLLKDGVEVTRKLGAMLNKDAFVDWLNSVIDENTQ